MSRKHQDPEYRKNARIVRAQVTKARRSGQTVSCWRCGFEIDPDACEHHHDVRSVADCVGYLERES